MSIFGTPANSTPATGGTSLFGSSATNNPPAAGGGLFGNSNAQTGQTNSLFGSTNNQQQQQQPQAGTSLFGSTNTNTNPAGTGTGLFGNTQGGGGLFGAKPAGTTTPATGGGLFGSTTGAPAAGNSLFGGTAQQQQQPAAAGGGLFGSTTTAPATGNSLFGSTNQQPANATGTNSFFSTPPAGQQQQQNGNQPKPGGLFGSSTATNPLFGGSTNTNTNAGTGTGSLFGASSTPGAGTGSLFGNTSTNANTNTNTGGTGSLFGSTSNTNPGGGLGSTLGSSTLGVSALGSKPAGSTLGGSTLGISTLGGSTLGAQNQGQDAQVQFARLQEKIETIIGAWNPTNPALCRFQHYFYNLVDPAQINMYTRPSNAVKEDLWQKAVRENPDPTCLVPVLAIGYDDLRDRVDAQAQQSTGHREKLTELQNRLRTLTTHHTTTTIPRLQRYSALQTQLLHRLLKLVTHLHLLIPSVRSSAIGEAEEELKSHLEEIASEVGVSRSSTVDNSARKGGRLKSKLGELWAVIGALKAREEGLNAMTGGGGEWKVVDEEGLARIAQVLAEQQAGLAHLTKILQKDLKDLAIIVGSEGIPS
ncbi:Nucleoporin nup57 [Marasmius crinis-equi]|uniref:Nucleoporin nup57 n=1 Tax=Marasmius crinis-equi TaxID=585013 RepID=A0ABR3FXD5_9AGAR